MSVIYWIVAALSTSYILIEHVQPLESAFLWWSTALAALGFGIWAVLSALTLAGVISSGEDSG